MQSARSHLDGIVVIEPIVHSDGRGFFLESYHREHHRERGVDVDFVQDNHSRSTKDTLRGLHFQSSPGQAKLVSVARGAAFDVVVDLRRSSPTFGEWESFLLDDERHLQVFIPIGFAHGFCALSDVVDFTYKVGSYYDAQTERGLAFDDPQLAIRWPTDQPTLSDRDRNMPTLAQLVDELPDW